MWSRVRIGLVGLAVALGAAATAGAQAVPVLMLSDLHFDPYRDSAKVSRLVAAPVTEWEAILNEPNSPHQAEDFAAIQAKCATAKGVNPDHTLLSSGLKAAKAQAAGVKFVTVSGDLLVHQFDCRYQKLVKANDPDGLAAFAAKTASYAMRLVEETFPGVPVYFALGNNDSGCDDYAIDWHDRFFAETGAAAIAGLRGATAAATRQAREDYNAGGYYAVTLPAPMKATRLLAIDDLFMSRKYKTCAGKPDATSADAVLAWLGRELDGARRRGERVWVMAHIPVGIDVYETLKKGDACGGAEAVTFLTPEATKSMGDMLATHADVVRLAIFGHTHMDEIKLLRRGGRASLNGVPGKGVAGMSPVNGNLPSFTLAKVDPASATMEDYAVFTASNKTGVDATWTREYGFREAYHEPGFSGGAVGNLVGGFHLDANGSAAASLTYERFFDPGSPISPLIVAWPQYACAMGNYTAAGFKACVCGAGK